MWTICCLFVFFSGVISDITFIEPRQPLPGTPSPPGSTWPQPQTQESEQVVFNLDPHAFTFESNAVECDIISKALQRYRELIFSEYFPLRTDATHLSILPRLNVNVKTFSGENCAYPRQMDDESYVLQITVSARAYLLSNTVWGALRGLETFSQLVYEESERLLINATHIVDWPRFIYRGIMLDTARHFFPISLIKSNLDAMSYNKMNVFHWHIVDDQSFPFESMAFPNLSIKGAYKSSDVYRPKDIKDVIAYARLLGIRVIPEFDTPGHTHGFGKAFPELLTSCYGEGRNRPNTPMEGSHAARENFDPSKNSTFDFLRVFFSEIKRVFPDEYIHLGMDEVYYDCWRSSPEIEKFMSQKGFELVSEVEQYYLQRAVQLVEEIGYKYMAWQDPTDNGVQMAPSTIIEIWKENGWEEKAREVAELGHYMVLSACWYLNYISYGEDWRKYYQCDPHSPFSDQKDKEKMIGGEACMWGEYVDSTNLLARLWPRASAVAERLWSSPDIEDPENAVYRLDEHRCRMLKRGIPAQPILNGYCRNKQSAEPIFSVTYHNKPHYWMCIGVSFLVLWTLVLCRGRCYRCRKLLMKAFVVSS